jgi:acyl carrier protein
MEDSVMSSNEIRSKIKSIIGSIAGIDPQRIADGATLRGELGLDSLSLLEVGVDVDLAFKLNLPDEAYKEIDSLPDMVDLVVRRTAEMQGDGGAAQAPRAAQAAPADRPAAVAG